MRSIISPNASRRIDRVTSRSVLPLVIVLGSLQQHVAFGQSASAAVNGTVRDDSGARVSDVRIVLTNSDTRVEHAGRTGSAGVYSLEDISPGNYSGRAIK